MAHDGVGPGVSSPLVERVHAVHSWGVFLDEELADRLCVHPLAEPGGGDGVESDVCGSGGFFFKVSVTDSPKLSSLLTEFMTKVSRVYDWRRERVRRVDVLFFFHSSVSDD